MKLEWVFNVKYDREKEDFFKGRLSLLVMLAAFRDIDSLTRYEFCPNWVVT